MASCLVLGADGFLGSHLVDSLLDLKHKVTAFDRFRNNQPRNLDPNRKNLSLVGGNFLNRHDLDAALKGVDYVFHLVSTTTPATSSTDPLIDVDTNIRMSVELFQLCVEHKVKRVIFPSTGGAIYGRDQDRPFSESDLPEPISPYAIGKLAIEGYLRYFKRTHDLDYLALRISNPYGERQNVVGAQGVIPIFLNLIKQGKPLPVYGDGTMVRDYIYVGDLTGMVGAVFNHRAPHHTYNVGSGQAVSLLELIDCLSEVTGKKVKTDKLPARPTDAHRVLLDTSRFQNDFGIQPHTDLKTGIAKTWQFINR